VNLRERFTTNELLHNQTLSVPVYEISNGVKSVRFGATEVSNCVWKIYTTYEDAKSMPQTYTINKSLISNLLKRGAYRVAKIYSVIVLIVLLPNLVNSETPIKSTIIAISIGVVMMGSSLALTYKKTRKSFSSLQIILDNSGIEYKSPMSPYKRIEWSEAAYIEKKTGDVRVYNKTVNSINRWWTGAGVILIPREINDRDQLLMSLDTHINK